MAGAALPPGPRLSLRSLLLGPGRDPLRFFTSLAHTYGDIAVVHMAAERLCLLNHPQWVKDVLVTQQKNFHKGRGLERAKRVLGDGLLTSEDQLHLRQRRLMQPAFHKERIASYAAAMTAQADAVQASWVDGATIDVAREMARLTLDIVGRTLFDADVEKDAKNVGDALTAVLDSFWLTMLPLIDVLERLPIPALRRSREARRELDRVIYRMIAERRADLRDRGDLLSMLLLAQDEEGDGTGMSDQQVRDEAMTIFLAGHETTANVLSWMWYLLGQSPEVEAELHEELDRVLGGRLPVLADLPQLRVTGSAILPRARTLPAGALDARVQGGAAAVCVLPVRRRNAALHRRTVRVDGADAADGDAGVALAIPRHARVSGRAAAGRHAAHEARAAGSGGQADGCIKAEG